MADMQTALRSRLLAASGVASKVGTRVDWVSRPQSTALPAVTLTRVSGEREQHLKGFSGFRSARVQADCWAATYNAATQLAEAVIASVVSSGTFYGIRFGRALVDEPRDLGDSASGTFIHRQSVDLTVFHHEEG